MAYKRKTYKRRAAPKRRVYKRKATKARTSMVRKVVKRMLAVREEPKTYAILNNSRNLYTSSSSSLNFDFNNIGSCAWGAGAVQISQGTGQGARIGNLVRLKKMTFKGSIYPLGYNASTNPAVGPNMYRMILFRERDQPTSQPSIIASGDIFQYGNTTSGLQDDPVDTWLSINKDKYQVVADRRMKIGYASSNGTGNSTASSYYNNNDFKMLYNFSFDVTKHLPKITKFNDNNSTPMTSNLYYAVWYTPPDGSGNGANRICAQMQYVVEATYTDA